MGQFTSDEAYTKYVYETTKGTFRISESEPHAATPAKYQLRISLSRGLIFLFRPPNPISTAQRVWKALNRKHARKLFENRH